MIQAPLRYSLNKVHLASHVTTANSVRCNFATVRIRRRRQGRRVSTHSGDNEDAPKLLKLSEAEMPSNLDTPTTLLKPSMIDNIHHVTDICTDIHKQDYYGDENAKTFCWKKDGKSTWMEMFIHSSKK